MKLTTRVIVPTALAGAIAVGAAAIAWADSTSPSPKPTPSTAKAGGGPAHRAGVARRALHGEFTVPQRAQHRSQGAMVQTMVVDTQRGQITAVDKTAKTV